MSHISLGTTCMILPAMMNSQGFGAELFSWEQHIKLFKQDCNLDPSNKCPTAHKIPTSELGRDYNKNSPAVA